MASFPSIFQSTDTGASTLNNVPGSWNVVLKSCLQTGYNAKPVSGIAVVAGVATVTCATHGYTDDFAAHVLIEGSSVPALNGKKQPSNVTTNTFTFPALGVADGSYAGSISARRAPLGWTETFNDGLGTSVFKPDTLESTGKSLRVNDSQTGPATVLYARIIGCESVTGVGAYSNPFPSVAQRTSGLYLQKGADTSAAKQWTIIGTDRFVYLLLDFGSSGGVFSWFGDFQSLYAPDPGACAINGGTNTTYGQSAPSAFGTSSLESTPSGPPYLSRDYSGLGAYSAPANQVGSNAGNNLGSGFIQQGSWPIYAISNAVYLSEGDATASRRVRGVVPGLCAPLAVQPAPHRSFVIAGNGDRYYSFWGSPAASASCAFFQLNNAWHD